MSGISLKLRKKIAIDAKNRCGYCLMPQEIIPMSLEIEHILPQSEGGTDDEENLWLSCRSCNSHKYAKTHGIDNLTKKKIALFNPRTQVWREHFEINLETGEIIGLTICGRATINSLRINKERAIYARKNWMKANWYPPKDY